MKQSRMARLILAWWNNRQPREKRLLTVAGMFCLVAVLIQMVWLSTDAINLLAPSVVALTRKVELARYLEDEIRRGAIPETADRLISPPAIADRGLPALPGLRISAPAQGRYQVEGDVAFDDWLLWLGGLQHGRRMVLVTAAIEAREPGLVSIKASLEQVD